MEKKPKLEFKCCYTICGNYYPDKQIHFVQFPETCLQFQQNCVNGSIDQHIIHCKDCEKASKWVEACGKGVVKSIYDITKNLYICGKHFEGGKGPTEENPYPVPITGGDAEVKTEEIDTNFIKEEKIETEEHPLEDIKEEKLDCDWIKQEENMALKEHDQPQCSKQNTNKPLASTQTEFEEDLIDEEGLMDEEGSMNEEDSMDEESLEETDTSEFETEESEDDTKMSQAEYQEQSMKHNNQQCYYNTGFDYNQICNLLKFFGLRPKIPDTNLTPIQQLIIVLMRLRRGTDICDLAIRNGTTSEFVIRLVKTWVFFMHSQFAKRFKERMPKKVDLRKLKGFHFLKNVSPLNNGGSMAPFVLVCACLLKFQPTSQ